MEKILNQLSNPFDKEGFKKIIDVYLQSNHWYDFYLKILSFYKDADILEESQLSEKDVQTSRRNFSMYKKLDIWEQIDYFYDGLESEHRIYINSPLGVTKKIVEEFQKECETQNLPFLLKYGNKKNGRNDNIIIGSSSELYKKHIDTLRKIASENPDLIKKCGTPPLLTASIDGWIGICDENTMNETVLFLDGNGSYNVSRVYAIDAAIKKFLLAHPELGNQVKGFEELKTVLNLIPEDADNREIELARLINKKYYKEDSVNFEIDRNDLKSLIQNNKVIDGIFEFFQRECELRGFDTNNPIFIKGTREKLLERDMLSKKEKNNIDIEHENFEKMVDFLYENLEQLSIEEKTKLLKRIISVKYNDVRLRRCIYQDVNFLCEIGVLDGEDSEEVLSEELEKILEHSSLEFKELQTRMRESHPIPSIQRMINPSLSEDEIKGIIKERIEQIKLYFKKYPISLEILKKCDEITRRCNQPRVFDGVHFTNEINNYTVLETGYEEVSKLLNEKMISSMRSFGWFEF